jgi:hypothetical protein
VIINEWDVSLPRRRSVEDKGQEIETGSRRKRAQQVGSALPAAVPSLGGPSRLPHASKVHPGEARLCGEEKGREAQLIDVA